MAAARRRRLSTRIASVLLALLVALPVAASSSVATTRAEDDPRLTITSISTVAEGDETATVRGRLTNTGSDTLTEPEVSVVAHTAGPRRSDIADWAQGTDPVSGTPLESTTLEDVPAGGSAPFLLEIDADALLPGDSAGAAWVSIQDETSAVHTFIGVHRRKEYVPLRMLWGIPLLLPTDRRLHGRDGERTQAWRDAVGEDSRLARLTQEPPAEDEAWILDPSLLDVPAEPADDAATDTGGPTAAERTVRSERAEALKETLVGSRTLVLPDADADVAAATSSRQGRQLVGDRLAAGADAAEEIGARSDVLWPADGLATGSRARVLDRMHPDGDTTLLVPDSSLVEGSFTPTGGERTSADVPIIVRDGPLSRLVAGLESEDDVVLARQQLVAETASVLRERPGTARTLVVVPDRDATPDPTAWEELRDSAADIPWLRGSDLPSVLEEADEATPGPAARSEEQIHTATKGDPTPAPVLTGQRAQRLIDDEKAMDSFASVRSDGPPWRQEMLPVIHQMTSARWRWDPEGHALLQEELTDEVTLTQDDLVVSTGDVNFFADTGRLQITIVNRTDVELSHLVVRLVPDNPSLRIDGDPDPLTIGPDGAQTVTVTASALAAGKVPVHVTVATPGGKQVAAPATLHVKVRPTGDSIYWVIGGLAVLLLAAGTWRTVRGGRRAAATSETDTADPEG